MDDEWPYIADDQWLPQISMWNVWRPEWLHRPNVFLPFRDERWGPGLERMVWRMDGAPASQRPQIPPFIFGQSANKTSQQTASFRGALAKIGKDHFFCVFWAVLKRLSRDDIFFRLLSGIACRWRLFQAASWEQKLYGKPIRGNVGINDRDMNPRSPQCRWMW